MIEMTRDKSIANLRNFIFAEFGIAIAFLAITTLIANILARRLTSGLDRLVKVAADAESGKTFLRTDKFRRDEIGFLARHMYRMLDTIHQEKMAIIEQTRLIVEKERLMIVQSRSATMGEMIRNIAHQWRQPLNTVGLVTQNIRQDYRDHLLTQESLEKDIDVVLRCVKNMSQTIDDFRDFFRNDKEKTQFNLHQAIVELLCLIEATLKNSQINVSLSEDVGLHAFGYPHEFSQVILNLLANAKDALIDNKVPHGRIEIELRSTDDARIVVIRDNAGGIPKAIEGRIFEPYFTTKIDGSGIGLYMSKIIIEKHFGGCVSFRNTGEGAEFTLSIPARPSKGENWRS